MFRRRLPAGAVLASLLAILPAAATAHTDLTSSDPADGSTLTDAPSEVVLTFESEISDASAFTVTGPSGDEVGTGELDLDAADRNVLRGDATVEDTGAYVVAYTIIGDDGDPIEGQVTFTYDPDGTASPGTPPDTAMAARTAVPPTVIVGIAFLGMGVVFGARRALRT